MQEKDILEKTLESYNDVFADIVNVLVFNGERVIEEDYLEDRATFSAYKAEGRLRFQERDVSKYWRRSMVKLVLIGLENMTAVSRYMPLRVMGYDGAAYRDQIPERSRSAKGRRRKKKAEKKGGNYSHLFPVITIVLYFGIRRWREKDRCLSGVLTFPEEYRPHLEKWFNDYHINVVEVAYLTTEQIAMFRSDFRVVAEYFVKSRTDPDYEPEEFEIKHVYELFDLLTAVSGDDRFKEIAMLTKDKAGIHEGQEVVTMRSQFIDNIWKRAKAEGEKIGEQRGELRGEKRGELRGEAKGDHRATIRVLRRSIDNMLKKTNYTRDEILDILEVSPEELKQLELTQN